MLILDRCEKQSILIGKSGEIKIRLLKSKIENGKRIQRIGIEAPLDIPIIRQEILTSNVIHSLASMRKNKRR